MREYVRPRRDSDVRAVRGVQGRAAESGAGLLALQRTAGNAAVTAVLRQGRSVQRSAVHDVLRSSGRPLGGGLQDEMEQRLGADFGDVRIQ